MYNKDGIYIINANKIDNNADMNDIWNDIYLFKF
jgi:hypothetical protein